MTDTKSVTVFRLRKCEGLSDIEIDFLSRLLFNARFDKGSSFSIEKALIDVCMVTKTKRTFDSQPTELLIYYKTPIPINPIPENHLIDIIDSKDEKKKYESLSKNIRYRILGTARIAELSIPQIYYINNLIKQLPIISPITRRKKNTKSPCSHYKSFPSNENLRP